MVSTEEQIWKDYENIIIENTIIENTIIESDKCLCKHLKKFMDDKEKSEICQDCGVVFFAAIFETNEWNTYKNEDGSYQASIQRADLHTSDNPYDIPGTIPGINKNSLMMRIHYQQTFSHKQKTFWIISEKLSNYCTHLGISNVLSTAKKMWHICMESGKLTRASVRNGLISACLYYACVFNNTPVDRQQIIDISEGNQKGFLKGEKIFMEIMDNNKTYGHLGKEKIDIKENDTFIKFCSELGLPYSTYNICNEIYTLNIEKLESVAPKSITAGVLFYVVKFKMGLKQPSKSRISQIVNVCIPTINKVINILEN
jgi:transcription initiation factor TFIIIB Brf1 subunit/transcription initiation factor TFIIB